MRKKDDYLFYDENNFMIKNYCNEEEKKSWKKNCFEIRRRKKERKMW